MLTYSAKTGLVLGEKLEYQSQIWLCRDCAQDVAAKPRENINVSKVEILEAVKFKPHKLCDKNHSEDDTMYCSFCKMEKFKAENKSTGGLKYDGEKPQMSLLSSIAIEGLAKVLTFGAKKYASHNWRMGIAMSRLMSAALRHLFAFIGGEDLDPESGLPHLDHAMCCLMFARELWQTHPHLDDRYKPEKKQ